MSEFFGFAMIGRLTLGEIMAVASQASVSAAILKDKGLAPA